MRPKSLLPCLKMELSDPVFLVPLDGTLPVAGTGAVPWCVCVAPAGTGAGWSAEFGGRYRYALVGSSRPPHPWNLLHRRTGWGNCAGVRWFLWFRYV